MTQQANVYDDFAERTATRWFRSAINGIRMKSKIMPTDLYVIDTLRIPPVGEMILFEYDMSLIIFYTPLGMEVGFNYQSNGSSGWITATFNDYAQYKSSF